MRITTNSDPYTEISHVTSDNSASAQGGKRQCFSLADSGCAGLRSGLMSNRAVLKQPAAKSSKHMLGLSA